jgi:predicted flap endonuclease-1-like 5' DNA nuclease
MTNPVHLLTVAALLLVCFLVGAVVGTIARLIALRIARKPAVIPATAVEATPATPPLVAAPVIAPLPVAPVPVTPPPAEVPVPDFAATLIALANDAPPTAFVEATKRTEVAPSSEIRTIPTLAPASPVETIAAAAAMQPAHVAGETTSGVHVAAPLHDTETPQVAVQPEPVGQRTAEVILFPSAVPEPESPRQTDIVVGGESVAVVDTSDLATDEPVVATPAASVAAAAVVAEPKAVHTKPEIEAPTATVHGDNFHFVGGKSAVAALEPPVSAPLKAKSETIPVPVISANAAVGAMIAAELPAPEVVEMHAAQEKTTGPAPVVEQAAAAPQAEAPSLKSSPEPEVVVEEPKTVTAAALEPVQAPAPAPQPNAVAEVATVAVEQPAAAQSAPVAVPEAALDEDAAMRAIEGNWSPRRTPPRRPVRPIKEPEAGANQAVAASARAVTAARRTAEAVVAEVAEVQAEVKAEAGRPLGLDGPRDGRKDDLTHIIGVLPVIETALNKLGIFHFDQVGALTDEQIGWIEGHLGVPGRIARELWREQARELSAVLRPRRVAEK